MSESQTGSATSSLPPKLEAVLARLCEKLGPIGKTKAVKLPYLVDVVARHALGRRITEGTHQTWDYGVVTSEAFWFFHGDGGPLFKIIPGSVPGNWLISLLRPAPAVLDGQEEEVVDHVAELYGRMGANRLGTLTKALNTDLEASDWGANRIAETGEDAYARLATGWQSLYEKLQQIDLSDPSQWGPPIDDVDEHLRAMLG